MSIIIQSKGDVTKSATNNSMSKFMYSFSKAPRFPSFKISGHTDAYYDIPVTRSTRATNFGFGKRSDFTMGKSNNKKNDDKGKTQEIQSNEGEKSKPHGPVYSFPKYDPTKIQKRVQKDKNGNVIQENLVGPGYYNYLRPFGSDALKFTMKGRNEKKQDDKKKEEEKKPKEQVEESYSLKNKDGKYVLSTMVNLPTFAFSHDKEKRFKYKYNDSPGPVQKLKEGEEEKPFFGHPHFNSKYRSNNGITISGRMKEIDSRSNYPGPGSYRLPSEWGQYQSKDADKYPTENVYPVEKIPFEEKAWRHGMKVVKEKPEDEIDYMEKEEVDKKSEAKLGGGEEQQEEVYIEKEEEEDKNVKEGEGEQDNTKKDEEGQVKENEPQKNEEKPEEKKDGEPESFEENQEQEQKVEGEAPQSSTQKPEEEKKEGGEIQPTTEQKPEEKKEGEEQVEGFVDKEEEEQKVEGEEPQPSTQKPEEKKDENEAQNKNNENNENNQNAEEFFIEQEEKEENINNLNQ